MRYLAVNEQQKLCFADIEKPKLKPGECLIKVKAIGVNRADILQKQGKYPAPAGESNILGIEVCGDIVQLSPFKPNQGDDQQDQIAPWEIGDKVFAIVPGGAYAEYVKVQTAHLFKLPTNFDYGQGAAIAEVFLTAYQCLFTIANLQKNSSVLIHAGASGVGSAAIQLAKQWGCHITVTVGGEEKRLACLALGADEAINYHQDDFVQQAKQHQPAGYNVIIDMVGGDYLNKNINLCALDGHIVILSMLGGRYSHGTDIAKMLFKRVNISATTLRSRSDDYKTILIQAFKAQFEADLRAGLIKPVIHQQISWQEAEQAHSIMMNNANIGKIILTIEQP